jgi:hypothetical protein
MSLRRCSALIRDGVFESRVSLASPSSEADGLCRMDWSEFAAVLRLRQICIIMVISRDTDNRERDRESHHRFRTPS